jgi:nucleoside-diphosphate-sugar epimerase
LLELIEEGPDPERIELGRTLRLAGPPPLTRHAVDLLCCDCTLRDDKARAELGYRPVIGVEEGLAALAAAG